MKILTGSSLLNIFLLLLSLVIDVAIGVIYSCNISNIFENIYKYECLDRIVKQTIHILFIHFMIDEELIIFCGYVLKK